jgi:ribosome-associated translation inhibitor RaiA
MVTGEQTGKILLEKFELNQDEMSKVQTIVDKYAIKIKHFVDYKEIKLEMRVHKKVNNSHFEIRGQVLFDGGKALSEKTDSNPFVAVDTVLLKMLTEIEHKIRK